MNSRMAFDFLHLCVSLMAWLLVAGFADEMHSIKLYIVAMTLVSIEAIQVLRMLLLPARELGYYEMRD